MTPEPGSHADDDVAAFLSTADDLEDRLLGASGIDVLRHGGVAPGDGDPGIAAVTLNRRHKEEFAVAGEHRREHVEIGEMSASGKFRGGCGSHFVKEMRTRVDRGEVVKGSREGLDLSIDEAATTALRAELAEIRGALP